jgi:hypothetical protein
MFWAIDFDTSLRALLTSDCAPLAVGFEKHGAAQAARREIVTIRVFIAAFSLRVSTKKH